MLSIPRFYCFDEINIVEALHSHHKEKAQVTANGAGCITNHIVPDHFPSLAMYVQMAPVAFVA